MFAEGQPGLVLSADAVAELRSDHFNAKRWISRALAEGKQRAAAAPQPPQQQHVDPASGRSPTDAGQSPTEAAGSATRRAPARSFPAPDSNEAVAQQLVTLLGVRKQAAAESLEDSISGALRYLPRASEDISRLAAETQTMRTKLQDVATAAAGVRDSSSVSDKLKELHAVRERLVRCRAVLNDAQLLTSRVSSVEAAIHDLPAQAAGSSSTASSKDDLGDFNRIADDIASMRAALRTLQAIDANYGASVRIQVDRFEAAMQRALEARCLDALKREDRNVAPPLLAALGKIGRDHNTLKTHAAALVQSRAGKFASEVVPAAAPSSSSSAGESKVPSALRRYAHSLVKVLAKDRAFFLDVLPRAGGDAGDAMSTSAHDTSVSSLSHDAKGGRDAADGGAATPSTTGAAAFRRYLNDVVSAIAKDLPKLFADADNEAFTAIADTVLSELVAPVLATLAPASDDQTVPTTSATGARSQPASQHTAAMPVTRSALAATLALPLFAHAARPFGQREAAAVGKCSSMSKPSDHGALAAALHASATRTARLLRILLKDAFVASSVRAQMPNDDAAVAVLRTARDAWDTEVAGFAERVLRDLPQASSSSSSSTRAQLETALAAHEQCAELPAHIEQARHELLEVLQALRDAIAPNATADDNTNKLQVLLSKDGLIAKGVAAAASVPAECRRKVLALVLHPAQRFLPTRESIAAASAGDATTSSGESERARELGEWVMELPMTLDSAGVSNDVQEWVAASVSQLLQQFATAVRASIKGGLAGLGREASATLLADLEHLESVVAAIDETPENTQVFRDLRREVVVASTEEAPPSPAAATTPTTSAAPSGGRPPTAPRPGGVRKRD